MEQIYKIIPTTILLLICVSCGSTKKKLQKEIVKVKDTVFVQRDSVVIQKINQTIKDTLFVSVATGNKKIDSIITKRFKDFKTSKQSGENSYKVGYDIAKKGFRITSHVGATSNIRTHQKDSIYKNKNTLIKKEKKQHIVRNRISIGFYLSLLLIILLVIAYVLKRLKII